ncbi:MAG: alpha/beta hydrolase [Anaerolineae bacterium]|nr:alpha/beta hydrolase [Anaerolineae bacterium]
MRILLRVIISVLVALLALPVMAQDTEVTLIPFTSEAFGIQGVQPDGWTQVAPGVVRRANSADDITLLAQQAAPMSQDAVLTTLLPSLRLTDPPEPVDTVTANGLTWSVYQVDVTAGALSVRVDMAVTEMDGKSYVILLQTVPDEYETLHTAVFLPALNALTPLTVQPTLAADTPYTEQEVTFTNGDITLAGTLSLPPGDEPHPAVILISGSGPQDRNETITPVSEIQSFRLIADALARAGIAVLRYDDRGVGQSTGVYADANLTDFTGDANAAVNFLLERPEINPAQIGLIGHSEGAIVAPMVALGNTNVAFIVSLAGPANRGFEVMMMQELDVLEASGASDEEYSQQIANQGIIMPLVEARDWDTLRTTLQDMIQAQIAALPEDQRATIGDPAEFAAQQTAQMLATYQSPWYQEFAYHNPADDWAQITIPVLGIFGEFDIQVNPDQNAPAMQSALESAQNPDFQIVTIPGMNHLLQQTTRLSLEDYGTLEPALHPDLMPTIIDWLMAHVDVQA